MASASEIWVKVREPVLLFLIIIIASLWFIAYYSTAPTAPAGQFMGPCEAPCGGITPPDASSVDPLLFGVSSTTLEASDDEPILFGASSTTTLGASDDEPILIAGASTTLGASDDEPILIAGASTTLEASDDEPILFGASSTTTLEPTNPDDEPLLM